MHRSPPRRALRARDADQYVHRLRGLCFLSRHRLQILGAIGTVDAQQATIEATLRLKDLSEEEACAQSGIAIDLLLNLWEPLQSVRTSAYEHLPLTRAETFVIEHVGYHIGDGSLNTSITPVTPRLFCEEGGSVSMACRCSPWPSALRAGARDVRVLALSDRQRGCRGGDRFGHRRP